MRTRLLVGNSPATSSSAVPQTLTQPQLQPPPELFVPKLKPLAPLKTQLEPRAESAPPPMVPGAAPELHNAFMMTMAQNAAAAAQVGNSLIEARKAQHQVRQMQLSLAQQTAFMT